MVCELYLHFKKSNYQKKPNSPDIVPLPAILQFPSPSHPRFFQGWPKHFYPHFLISHLQCISSLDCGSFPPPELKPALSLNPVAFCDPEHSQFSSSSPFFVFWPSFPWQPYFKCWCFPCLLPKSFLGCILHVHPWVQQPDAPYVSQSRCVLRNLSSPLPFLYLLSSRDIYYRLLGPGSHPWFFPLPSSRVNQFYPVNVLKSHSSLLLVLTQP